MQATATLDAAGAILTAHGWVIATAPPELAVDAQGHVCYLYPVAGGSSYASCLTQMQLLAAAATSPPSILQQWIALNAPAAVPFPGT